MRGEVRRGVRRCGSRSAFSWRDCALFVRWEKRWKRQKRNKLLNVLPATVVVVAFAAVVVVAFRALTLFFLLVPRL